jgi:Family of unknown function (DUF5670)
MFLVLGVILAVAWLFGFVVFHVSTGLIHLLLLVALVSVVWHFVTGNRVTPTV